MLTIKTGRFRLRSILFNLPVVLNITKLILYRPWRLFTFHPTNDIVTTYSVGLRRPTHLPSNLMPSLP